MALVRLRTGLNGVVRQRRGAMATRLTARPSALSLAAPARPISKLLREFLGRPEAVSEEKRGVPEPEQASYTGPYRPRSSVRPPYASERWQTPEEREPRDAKQRYMEQFMGMGVERVETHEMTRLDELGNPVPRHLFPQFPKSRKLIQDFDVVVVGSGAGGMSVAHRLAGNGMREVARQLDAEGNLHLPQNEARFQYKTLVIEPNEQHFCQPMWTLVGGGKRDLADSVGNTLDYVMGIDGPVQLLPTSVVEFRPFENAVITADGRKVVYKQLVVAAGLENKINKVKGLSDALGRAGVSSNYVYPYPQRTWDMVRFFPGGNALFTVPSGTIKCAGAPQKIMYLAEEYWRRHVGRDRVNIKFMSGLGKLFGVPHYEKTLLEQCKEKGIEDLNFGLNLVEVDGPNKQAVFERVIASAAGSVGDRVTVPYDFLHVTPPQGPYDFIASSQLADANGWLDVNKETLQHNRFPNVFALGDCTSLPTSKTAAAAGAQSLVLAENLIRYRESRPLTAKYDGYTACPFTLGNGQAMFAEFDYQQNRMETLPFANPSAALYKVKEEWLPSVYFERLLKGNHNMADYRKWFGTAKPAPKPEAQAQA